MRAEPVDLYVDCTHCLVEGAAVETYDPLVGACRFGVPAHVRCRLCGARAKGVVSRKDSTREPPPAEHVAANACPICTKELPPTAIDAHACESCGATATLEILAPMRSFATKDDLARALDGWSLEEGYATRGELLGATFSDPDEDEIFAALRQHRPIETVCDPFALHARAKGTDATTKPVQLSQPPRSNHDTPPPPSAPPRAIVYPLVSVIAADGELHPNERALVDKFLASEGLEPLRPEEFVVHTPADVARYVPKERREDVVRLMCESAAIDGMPDPSEVRVIRAFANAWRVPEEKVDLWLWGYENINASPARQLWLKIRRFVLSSRWETNR